MALLATGERTICIQRPWTIDNLLPSTDVPLLTEMTAREFIEAAFVLLQTDANSDPFKFTIAYYGYDHHQGVTTYLGYFIVSIGNSDYDLCE